MAAQTFAQISGARNHGASMATIEKICRALDTTPGELLELAPDAPTKSTRSRTKKTKRKGSRRR